MKARGCVQPTRGGIPSFQVLAYYWVSPRLGRLLPSSTRDNPSAALMILSFAVSVSAKVTGGNTIVLVVLGTFSVRNTSQGFSAELPYCLGGCTDVTGWCQCRVHLR